MTRLMKNKAFIDVIGVGQTGEDGANPEKSRQTKYERRKKNTISRARHDRMFGQDHLNSRQNGEPTEFQAEAYYLDQ